MTWSIMVKQKEEKISNTSQIIPWSANIMDNIRKIATVLQAHKLYNYEKKTKKTTITFNWVHFPLNCMFICSFCTSLLNKYTKLSTYISALQYKHPHISTYINVPPSTPAHFIHTMCMHFKIQSSLFLPTTNLTICRFCEMELVWPDPYLHIMILVSSAL